MSSTDDELLAALPWSASGGLDVETMATEAAVAVASGRGGELLDALAALPSPLAEAAAIAVDMERRRRRSDRLMASWSPGGGVSPPR